MEGCCHWVWRPRLEVSSVSTWTLDSLSLGYTIPHQKASIILTVVPLEGTYHSSPAASRVFSVSFLFSSFIMMFLGFPGGSDGKESACKARDLSSIPGLGRFPWRRSWQPTPVFLPGDSHGQKSLVSYSPWGHRESHMTEHLSAHTHTHTHTHNVTGNSLGFLSPWCDIFYPLKTFSSNMYSVPSSLSSLGTQLQVGMVDDLLFSHMSLKSVLVFPLSFLSVLHSGWLLLTHVCPRCTVWICINQTCRGCDAPVFHLFHWSSPLVCFSLSHCLFFHSVCSAVNPTQQILPFKPWALSCRIPTCSLSELPHLCWNSLSINLFHEKKWKC